MSKSPPSLLFELDRLAATAVESVLEGLRLDSDHVSQFSFDEPTGQLRVDVFNDSALKHIDSFVNGMLQSYRFISRKVLQRTEFEGCVIQDIDDELVSSPDLHMLGDGLVGYRGALLGLFRYFERQFLLMSREFQAEENQYPTLIPRELLAEVGYLKHFPQHVTFCSPFGGYCCEERRA